MAFDQERAAAILYPNDVAPEASKQAGGLKYCEPTPSPVAPADPNEPSNAEAPDAHTQAEAVVPELEPDTLGERMYPGDGTPPSDGNYLPMIRSAFDDLERDALREGDDEAMVAFKEGREQVNATLQELGVGAPAARELSVALSNYRNTPTSDEGITVANERAHKQLREAWGRSYDHNLAYARTAYQEACRRMPWLRDELESGAGSDPAVIKHFASIGRRMASKARR